MFRQISPLSNVFVFFFSDFSTYKEETTLFNLILKYIHEERQRSSSLMITVNLFIFGVLFFPSNVVSDFRMSQNFQTYHVHQQNNYLNSRSTGHFKILQPQLCILNRTSSVLNQQTPKYLTEEKIQNIQYISYELFYYNELPVNVPRNFSVFKKSFVFVSLKKCIYIYISVYVHVCMYK